MKRRLTVVNTKKLKRITFGKLRGQWRVKEAKPMNKKKANTR